MTSETQSLSSVLSRGRSRQRKEEMPLMSYRRAGNED